MAARSPDDTHFDDVERRDLLHAGRLGYGCGRIAPNLGLQDVAKPIRTRALWLGAKLGWDARWRSIT
jgi:hypothetical protein